MALAALALVALVALPACLRASTSTEHTNARASRLVTAIPPTHVARVGPACVTLGDGRVLVAGGDTRSSAELYDPLTKSWATLPDMSAVRSVPTGTLLADGRVLVVGGSTGTAAISTTEIFDPVALMWSPGPTLQRARVQPAIVPLRDGSIVAIGGADGAGNALSSVERLDFGSNRWNPLPERPAPFANQHQWVMQADGTIFTYEAHHQKTAYIFDPVATKWTPTDNFLTYRARTTVIPLAGGRIMLAGGDDVGGGEISTTEIYDPPTKSFSPGPNLAAPSGAAWWGTLPDATIVVGGKRNALSFVSSDGSNVVAGGFLVDARERPCAQSLTNGVMVIGGADPVGSAGNLSSAELISGSSIGANCTTDLDCDTAHCDVTSGKCAPTPASDGGVFSVGATPSVASTTTKCVKDSDCSTGHCADGVCCNTACRAACHSCALPSAPGTCTLEPVGVDLRGECGTSQSCTGTCNGAGACIGAGAGAQCAPSHCTSSSGGVGPAVCTAYGARCPTTTVTEFDCSPYACDPAFGACVASCKTNADCTGGNSCDANSGKCSADSAEAGGGCAYAATPIANRFAIAMLLAVATTTLRARSRRRGRA